MKPKEEIQSKEMCLSCNQYITNCECEALNQFAIDNPNQYLGYIPKKPKHGFIKFSDLLKEDGSGIVDRLEKENKSLKEGFELAVNSANSLIKKLRTENKELRDAMQWFVDRCESGEVRSHRTYTRFKNLLNQTK